MADLSSELGYALFLAALGGERLFELWLSRRNSQRAFARGGVEVGRRHFRVMSLVHALFFASALGEVWWLGRPFSPSLGLVALTFAVAAQALRYWAIATLGERWNVRVISVPGDRPVTHGPYRWLRHPNYVAVAIELMAVPLIHGAWLTAGTFTLLNAGVLWVRIRTEELSLGADYEQAFAGLPRFFPKLRQR